MSTPRSNIVVMKFGGTSVEDATAILRTAAIVASRLRRNLNPIVVVSAMSRVTDTLLAAAAAAGRNDREEALKISDALRTRHLNTAAELVSNPPNSHPDEHGDRLTSLQLNIHHDFDTLDDLLRGISAVGELTPRTSDNVVSFGERLSSVLVTAAFAQQSIPSTHVDARTVILTDNHYGKAAPNEPAIEAALTEQVLPLIDLGRVPVMGGFIGSCNGITTTLGRGGSDYTAAIVGGALHAGAIEIWTDVNGIMTTDPRIVPEALRVKTISFEEAAELAYFGAKVLHPATILPAVQKNIPVFVLNSRNADNEGTKITATPPPCASPFKSIAAKKKLTIIDIVASRMLLAHGFLAAVFAIFDKHGCAIDMVSTSEISVSVTVDSKEALPAICADLGQIADVKYEGNKALICLVGEDIRGQSGISGQVFSSIAHVNVRMISQGASEINMSFMVNEEDVDEALRSLHKKFFANPDPTIFDIEARVAAMDNV
ncbi:lysine-sensitive aspartokinase 3 [Granulicella sp. L46]|uniref:lysine-sensitive aspartokinase 3 n=1 Tax=Granulicella sp. L46 TaxID=1641865 RepID=UPI00131B5240|nr:lysine-sensitive aspartokinase 3 [Granulicella sp. L46]